jgi:hypothetical protein
MFTDRKSAWLFWDLAVILGMGVVVFRSPGFA